MAREKLDATSLSGRIFVSPSGNLGRIKIMELGAATIIWRREPSFEDFSALHQWMEKELGVGIESKNHLAGNEKDRNFEEEKVALEFWKKELDEDTN